VNPEDFPEHLWDGSEQQERLSSDDQPTLGGSAGLGNESDSSLNGLDNRLESLAFTKGLMIGLIIGIVGWTMLALIAYIIHAAVTNG